MVPGRLFMLRLNRLTDYAIVVLGVLAYRRGDVMPTAQLAASNEHGCAPDVAIARTTHYRGDRQAVLKVFGVISCRLRGAACTAHLQGLRTSHQYQGGQLGHYHHQGQGSAD